MWIVEKYAWWCIGFALLWALLYASDHFACSAVNSDQMKPFLTTESFVIVRKGTQYPDQVEVQRDVLQFERASAERTFSRYVARVIGKPGDRVRIERGKVTRTPKGGGTEPLSEKYISLDLMAVTAEDFEEILVPRGHYWLMGDNRKKEADKDSRKFGPISVYAVEGAVDKMPFTK